MGYISWHNYGYGIRVSDIKEVSVERLQAMLNRAPNYEREIAQWLQECGIETPTYEDYIQFDDEFCLGLATLMRETIEEAEGVRFVACDDYDSEDYLIYPPRYPWELDETETKCTEETIRDILSRYVSILTDEEIEIDYQSVENGG